MNKLTLHLAKKLTGIDIEQLQEDNDALLVKNQQLSFEVKDANKEAAYKRSQLAEAQEELTQAQTEIARQQTVIAGLQKEITSLQTEINSLQAAKESGLDKLQHATETLAAREEDVKRLQEHLSALEQECSGTRQQLQLAEQQKLQAEHTANRLQEEQKAFTDSLKQAEAELQQTVQAYAGLQAEQDSLRQTCATAQEEAARNKEAETAAKTELEATKSALETARNELADKRQELERTYSELEALRNKPEPVPEHDPEPLEQTPASRPQAEEPAREPESLSSEPEPTSPKETHPAEETPRRNTNLLEAYQEMKAKLEESTLKYPYTRITTGPVGNQYIYESGGLQLKAELFVWGVEGKEVILDETHFIPYNEIQDIEGLETPYATEETVCDFSDEGNATEIAETLLSAICSFHPLHIVYKDKNGRFSRRNLYWTCFRPLGPGRICLPYPGTFLDLFNDEIDTEHVVAMCPHNPEPRIFIIGQIQSVCVFDAFVTTESGIGIQVEGFGTAVRAEQPDVAELILKYIPEKFRKEPYVVRNRAHLLVMEGDYQHAMELYLSLDPHTLVDGKQTWAAANTADFNEFISRGIHADEFAQLNEALREAGWNS